jgi:4-amino-4-deoxy-L-arabinose transferase-like glycosyltransferase
MESAEDVIEGGRLDDHFIYMPGYVLALAAVKAMGGGLVACKLLGVATAALAAAGVTLLGARTGPWPTGLVAGLLYALWPAGIAVGSVTGTDAPAGALIVTAVALLVDLTARGRPRLAALVFGIGMGLAAWIRAVAFPLAVLSFLVLRVFRQRFRVALAGSLVSVCAALLVLAPWAVRNHRLYGSFTFTDSHGGHTALVGSNPNSDGAYSRSLNRLFTDVTGYRLFDSPDHHRASDEAAYAMAKRLARFEPSYTLGLVILKADRLLSHERNLLYWPLYRQGVLQGETKVWADAHRPTFEGVADGFWYALLVLALSGATLMALDRRRDVLAWLGFPVLLAAIYVAFFAEVRYHLAFAPFLFPLGATTVVRLAKGARDRRTVGLTTVGAAVTISLAWPALLRLGFSLRENHRFAATAITIDGRPSLALWRRLDGGRGPSPVKGTGNALGLQWSDNADGALTEIALPAGQWYLQLRTAAVTKTGLEESGTQPVVPELPYSVWFDGQLVLKAQTGAANETFTKTLPVAQYGTHTLVVHRDDEASGAASRASTIWFDELLFLRQK